MKQTIIAALVASSLAVPCAAQSGGGGGTGAGRGGGQAGSADADTTLRAALSVRTRVTPGAPYSAEAVTEATQVLADGNRISRKTIVRLYRDGEGRTRREQVDADTGNVVTVTISDPATGANFTLDPANRVAWRTGVVIASPTMVQPSGQAGFTARTPAGAGSGQQPPGTVRVEPRSLPPGQAERSPGEGAPPPPPPPPLPGAPTAGARGGGGGGGMMMRTGPGEGQVTREDLGPQTIEGVPATGTRSTTVIAAGAIGNAQPIKIVSEQWTSPDLQVLVMTRHNDPRSGETTYRLTNIVRAEPDRSLFSVPPDYTVKEQNIRRLQQ